MSVAYSLNGFFIACYTSRKSDRGCGDALRKENRILFEDMLDRCKKKGYVDCAPTRHDNIDFGPLIVKSITY
jgi:hypothetical protein